MKYSTRLHLVLYLSLVHSFLCHIFHISTRGNALTYTHTHIYIYIYIYISAHCVLIALLIFCFHPSVSLMHCLELLLHKSLVFKVPTF